MSWAHLHLALNHVPVIGLPIVLLLLAWSLARRSLELTKVSFGLLVLLAIVTIIVQLTGEPAEELVEGLSGVLESIVERHEAAAVLRTIGMVALGVIALIGLWRLRAGRALARWYPSALLVAGVIVAGLMGWIANLGGQIRHSEIRADRGATLDSGRQAPEGTGH